MIPRDKEIVVKALRTPYAPLRVLAMSYVSLSRDEMRCVIGCIVDGKTNEELAEELERSPKFVSRHRGEGLRRLQYAWTKLDPKLLADMVDYT